MDKAIVAAVMAVIYFSNTFIGTTFSLDPTAVQAIVVAVLPFLVFLIPNKKIA